MATSPGQITGPVCVCEELRRRRLLWIQQAGDDHFSLMSDVGSKLYIDGKLVINNDGLHSVEERTGSATLKTGLHRISQPTDFDGDFSVALCRNDRDRSRNGVSGNNYTGASWEQPPGAAATSTCPQHMAGNSNANDW
jgi:hypothetical protein